MLDPISFGTWLRHKRRALDLTQKALADQVGCAEITVRRMEADEYKPSKELALLLVEKLGIPESERTYWMRFARGLEQYPEFLRTSFPAHEQKNNLPLPLTSFIGRETEIDTVQRLITSPGGGRLLTLTGAGGSGKTRLALEVAARLRDHFPDGVWFIEFAALTDAALVLQSVLTILGLREQPGRSSISIVSDFLQPRRILLILDNCEHLIQACAQLVDELRHDCPALHILVTSREALNVAGEMLYLVPTLTTPDPAQVDLATLPQYEAVQLFVERAQNALPGFALTEENVSAVARVCHQLDGIPLAIELAAARVKALRVEQIAARFVEHDPFRLLTGGHRTAPPRHQTLHALIDWSHDLLPEPERMLLRRLSVFAGGWSLPAAEAVCTGVGVEADDLLYLMTQLVNKSLIIAEREQGREAHYRILETIRQYSSDQLLNAGEREQLRNKHLDFFLEWSEQVEPKLRGPQQMEWFDLIEGELDNLRVALEWSLSRDTDSEASLRLSAALLAFWHQRGHIREGRAWLARALSGHTASRGGAARAKALYAAGTLANRQGDNVAKALLEESVGIWQSLGSAGRNGWAYALASLSKVIQGEGDPATARSLADQAASLFREQDDPWGLAYALTSLGVAIRDQEDFTLARSILNDSVAIWRGLGDLWGMEYATGGLGVVAHRQGDYEVAQRHFADRLALARKLGDQESVAISYSGLGRAALNMGDRAQAKSYFEESYSLCRESGNKSWQAECLYWFGLIAQFEGDDQQAKTFFTQVLALAHEIGPLLLRATSLMGLAAVAAADGQARRAARLLGAADVQLEAGASYWDAAESQCIKMAVDRAVAQLGETVFAHARAEGRGMTFEQAANYALEEN